MKTKKSLFVITIDNIINLITNSSSELFILKGESMSIVKEMISEVYPNYLHEYQDVVSLRDADTESISSYLCYIEDADYDLFYKLHKLPDAERLKKEEEYKVQKAKKYGMEPEMYYNDWANRFNKKIYPYHYWYQITDEGLRQSAKFLDPEGKIFLLFSHNENPNWEEQEKLMSIAVRHHLG